MKETLVHSFYLGLIFIFAIISPICYFFCWLLSKPLKKLYYLYIKLGDKKVTILQNPS